MTQYAVVNSYVELGLETTRGTLSGAMKSMPVKTPQITPQQAFLRDMGMRGSPVDGYGNALGVRHDEYDMKSDLFADTICVPLRAILGGTDTVTGAGPYVHTIGLVNNVTGSQPPSLSIQDFDGANAFQMLACQADEFKLTWGAEKAAEWELKAKGNPFSAISNPSTAWSTEVLIPGWSFTTVIGGTTYATVVEGELTFARAVTPIFTGGKNTPEDNFASELAVSGKMRFVVESTSDFITNGSPSAGYSVDPLSLALTFTEPVSGHTIALTMTTVQFHNSKRDRSKKWVEVDTDIEANGNTTDATSTGFSQVKAVVTNAVSAAF